MITKITDPLKMPISINCDSFDVKDIQKYLDRKYYSEYLEIFLYDLNDELNEKRVLRYVDGKGYCIIEYHGLSDYKGYNYIPEEYIPVEYYIETNKGSFKTAKIKNLKGISLVILNN